MVSAWAADSRARPFDRSSLVEGSASSPLWMRPVAQAALDVVAGAVEDGRQDVVHLRAVGGEERAGPG